MGFINLTAKIVNIFDSCCGKDENQLSLPEKK